MKWFITGGAAFIGCNAAARLRSQGHHVVIADDLSRAGAAANLEWLRSEGPVEHLPLDVSIASDVDEALARHQDADVVLHLAAQVAVTTSVSHPRRDFEINALGTFNVCEAVRAHAPEAILLNASTNKVYGEMDSASVELRDGRYAYANLPMGVSEQQPLDFHSPYGCSKGTGDQYVHDYGRIYGLRTVNFRQSCIYGPRQFGIEDQGWVAWFAIRAAQSRPVTIYGDGRQVRDVLAVGDLIDCYQRAVDRIDVAAGQSFNIGGGPHHTLSLLELIDLLESAMGQRLAYSFADWRPGDQRVFVCDVSKASEILGWEPKTSVRQGVTGLVSWVERHLRLFEQNAQAASTSAKAA